MWNEVTLEQSDRKPCVTSIANRLCLHVVMEVDSMSLRDLFTWREANPSTFTCKQKAE